MHSTRQGRSLSSDACFSCSSSIFSSVQSLHLSDSAAMAESSPKAPFVMAVQAFCLLCRKWNVRDGQMVELKRACCSFDVSCLFASSSLPRIFDISRPSRGVPDRVEGRLINVQLSGWPVSYDQAPFWMPRKNLAVGLAKAFSFCSMMSIERGISSPDDRIRSLRVFVSCGAGFWPSTVPRLRSICSIFDEIFCFSLVWDAWELANTSREPPILRIAAAMSIWVWPDMLLLRLFDRIVCMLLFRLSV